MITWIRDNQRLILKAIVGSIGLAYLWSITFKLLLGMHSHVYLTPPWFVFQYLGADNGVVIKKIALSGGVTFLMLTGLLLNGLRQKYLQTLHGDAHWASEAEIRKTGLRAEQGILVGKKGFNYLCAGGTEHVLCYAPSRSNKGVGIVIPNLLNWEGSVICLDIKRENFNVTSGYRQKYSEVHIWDPTNQAGNTARFNPLSHVDKSNHITRIDELDKIGNILLPSYNDKGDIWQPAARELFIALALLLIDLKSPRFTLGEILRTIRSSDDFSGFVKTSVTEQSNQLDPVCIRNLNGFLQKAVKEQSGVLSTLTTALNLWNNPIIDAATSETDFDIRALRRRRITIYVAVQPDDLARLSPLITLFFQQVLSVMTRQLPGEDEPHKVLMLLDEFTSLSKMPVLEKGIGFFAGYNVRLMPIIQGISQLEAVYGVPQARSFQQNCKVKIAYAQNDEVAAAQISRSLGTKTIKSFSHSHQTKGQGGSVSQSYIKRELMMPAEVMQLDKTKEIVMVEASPPVLAKKIIYYKDNNFKERLYPAAEVVNIDLEEFIQSISGSSLDISEKNECIVEDVDTIVDTFFDRELGN